MKKNMLLFFIILFSYACVTSKDENHLTFDDFFREAEVLAYVLSPDGKYIASLEKDSTEIFLFVRPVQDRSQTITKVPFSEVSSIMWKGDDILILKDQHGDESYQIYKLKLNGEISQLTADSGVSYHFLNPLLEFSDDEVLLESNKRNPQYFDCYRFNINTKEFKLVAQNPGKVTNWAVDRNGHVRAGLADGFPKEIYYRKTPNEEFSKILTFDRATDYFKPIAFDENNEDMLVLSNIDRDTVALVKFSVEKMRETEVIYHNEKRDIVHNDKTKSWLKVAYLTYLDQRYLYHFLNENWQAAYNNIKESLDDEYIISMWDSDSTERFFIARASTPQNRGHFYLYDLQSKRLELLGSSTPWFNDKRISKTQPIQYFSRDGLEIHGYLTLPYKGSAPYPLIVYPHGGPWSRDIYSYREDVLFLASLGYAVFQPNFRGSTGFGRKFWEASFKEWGRAMQDDITDGVHWLIKEKIAQQDRICIYGGSWGGYAALAGVTFTPDLYKCGISSVGISNIISWLESIPPYWGPYRELFYEMVGHPVQDKELLQSASPYFHADKIKVPVLIFQGRNDPRVPFAESQQMVEAIKKNGGEVEFVIFEDEGHIFRKEKNKKEFYMKMAEFLKKHL